MLQIEGRKARRLTTDNTDITLQNIYKSCSVSVFCFAILLLNITNGSKVTKLQNDIYQQNVIFSATLDVCHSILQYHGVTYRRIVCAWKSIQKGTRFSM